MMSNSVIPMEQLENGKKSDEGQPKARVSSMWPLFWYPYWVNSNTSRFVGLLHMPFLFCGIIFRNTPMMNKIVAGIALSYLFIFLAGARASPIGLLAEFFSQWFKPKMIPGPPKQFAAACGLMFSGIAALMLLFMPADHGKPGKHPDRDHELYGEKRYGGVIIAACVLLAIHLLATALEAFLDFCLGCVFFRIGTMIFKSADALSQKIDSAHEDVVAQVEDDYTRPTNLAAPRLMTYPLGPGGQATAVDPRWKQTTDDWKDWDFHPIRHHQITYFIAPMGLAGIAIVWKLAHQSREMQPGQHLWQALAIFAAIAGFFTLVLYLLKFISYPRKVIKEWYHPVKSNAFAAIPITILLFASLTYHFVGYQTDGLTPKPSFNVTNTTSGEGVFIPWDGQTSDKMEDWNRNYKALWWTGSMIQVTLAVWCVGRWFSEGPSFIEHANPTMLMAPLGLFVAAFAGANFKNELCWLFFSFALFMWLILTPVTMARSFFYHQLEDRLRPSVLIYLAASSMACAAYQELNYGVWDNFTLILFWFSWGNFLLMAALTFQRFFGQTKFEMTAWMYLFPLTVFAAINIAYRDRYENLNPLATAMTIVAMSVANLCAVQLLLMTTIGVTRPAKKQVWVSDDKWGPVSFMKASHFAFRNGAKKLAFLSRRIKAVDNPESVNLFVNEYSLFSTVLEEHGRQEDQLFFPYVDRMFPGFCAWVEGAGHDELHAVMAKIQTLSASLASRTADDVEATTSTLQAAVVDLQEVLNKHLDAEELNVGAVLRKYGNLEMTRELSRQMFFLVPTEKWSVYLSYVVSRAPLQGQRIRFLRALGWALPEYRQHIGRLLYNSIDYSLWERIVRTLPEFVPRIEQDYSLQRRHTWHRYW